MVRVRVGRDVAVEVRFRLDRAVEGVRHVHVLDAPRDAPLVAVGCRVDAIHDPPVLEDRQAVEVLALDEVVVVQPWTVEALDDRLVDDELPDRHPVGLLAAQRGHEALVSVHPSPSSWAARQTGITHRDSHHSSRWHGRTGSPPDIDARANADLPAVAAIRATRRSPTASRKTHRTPLSSESGRLPIVFELANWRPRRPPRIRGRADAGARFGPLIHT